MAYWSADEKKNMMSKEVLIFKEKLKARKYFYMNAAEMEKVAITAC